MNIIIKVILWFTYLISLYFAVFWFLVFLDKEQKKKQKKLTEFPFVSIVIPAYNEEKRIKPTIKSALGIDYPKEKFEIVVVNDGSTDKTKEVVEKTIKKNKDFNIKLINQENKGKGAALNKGLKISKGKYFVCFDADSFVRKNALKLMLPYFKDKNVAAVLPVLKVRRPKNILQRMQWFEYLINMFYKELMSKLNCVHVAPGPFSVYRKGILKKVGGFDENNNLTEDLEMTLRLQSNHYKIVQLLDAEVSTIAPETVKQLYKQRNRWYKGSIYNAIRYRKMMFNKKYGDFGLMQMPTIIVSGVIAIVLIASVAYYGLKPRFEYLYNLSFVNFDLLTILKNFSLNFYLIDLDYMTILVALVMLLITVFILKKSHTYTNEKINKYGAISLVFYILLYFLLLGIMWMGITIDLIIGRKQRW